MNISNATSRRVDWLFIAAVVVVSALVSCLHLWNLGAVPAGFYVDESSIAYNAYAIARTGADEYGTRYPVFFRCFGEFKDAVTIYSVAPFVNAFGLREGAARLPSALYGLLAAAVFGLLAREYVASKWLALLAGAAFALMPWAFPISRSVIGGLTPMLFGITLGCWLLLVAVRRKSIVAAGGSGAAFAFAMYSASIARPVSALLLVAFGLSWHRHLISYWRQLVAFAVAGACALIPMIVALQRNIAPLTARFDKISIFFDDPSRGEALYRFLSRYGEYLSPGFLLMHGDANLRHHTGLGGELFWSMVPLIAVGLYALLRGWRWPEYRFVVLGLLASPVAAALTIEPMHATRSLACMIFWLLVAVVGAGLLWEHGRYGRIVVIGACIALSIETGRYLGDYFGDYQSRCRDDSLEPVTEAMRSSFDRLGPGQTLYVSSSAGVPIGHAVDSTFRPLLYTHLTFYGKVDPEVYQRQGLPPERIRFYDGTIPNPGILLRCNAVLARFLNENRIVAAKNPEALPPSARLVQTVPAGGPMNYEIYEVGPMK